MIAPALPAPALPAPAGVAKRKRTTISDACTSCRRSKVKCEEAKPCTRCVNHGWRDSCVSWRQLKASRRQESGAVRVDLAAPLLLLATPSLPPPPPPPPPPTPPPEGGAQLLFGLFHSLPHGALGAVFAPAQVRLAPTPAALSAVVVGEESCAGQDAADGDKSVTWRSPSPSPTASYEIAALIEDDTELSDAENDDFWRSVEHLKAVPIAFDQLL